MAFNSSSGSLNGKIPRSIWVWTFGAATTFFICSSLRHALFQSTAFDLGIFDQAVYLISRNLPPISTFTGFHILGDHAAIIFYPIAILYKIYPDVHWLFAIQALTLLPSCSKITYGKLVRRFVATGSNLGDFPAGRE
jgi:uncharacterized membrane protein